VERGWITPDQLAEARAEQSRDSAQGRAKPRPLGNILASKGYLSSERLVSLLDEQQVSSSEPPPGTPGKGDAFPFSFGKYSLLREVGRGGMGVVYEALDTVLHRKVALKLVLSDVEGDADRAREESERFMKEARLSATLSKHPHIVGVYDAGVIEGKCYLTMEFIEGMPMSKWRKSGSAPLRDQIVVLRDVARAVHHAHQHGIIHRDLKPDNILIGAQTQPHVTDFGLAKSLNPSVTASLTAQGKVMGTPHYMSPEQAQGLPTVDHRTDIWSLGVILYESLTGRPPFTGETPLRLIMRAVNDPVPSPSNVLAAESRPAPDPALEEICLRALSKDPRMRPGTSEALAEELDRWLRSGARSTVPAAPAAPAAAPPPPPPPPRKRSRGGLILSSAALLAAAGVAYATWGLTPSQRNLGLARLLSWIGRDEEALARYEAVLAVEPSNLPALRGREALREKAAGRGRDPAAEGTGGEAKAGKEESPAKAAASLLARHRGPVDPAFMNAVAALGGEEQAAAVLQKLRELNPKFTGKSRHKVENGKVMELTVISSSISDLSPIRALAELKEFDLTGESEPGSPKPARGRLEDLTPLRGMALHRLRTGNNPVCDLSPLRGMPLTLLALEGTDVADLLPLRGMRLTWLDLAGTPVVDLAPLGGMPLEFLVLGDTGVTDVSVLKDMPLQKLFLLKTKITDFSPIRDCPLVLLRFPYVAERDAALVRSIKTLKEINMLPAADFLSKHPLPWLGLYDGKSTDALLLEPKAAWSPDKGVLTGTGPDYVLVTREEFEDGEFRIRFRCVGVTFLSLQVRHSVEKGYAAIPEYEQLTAAPPRGNVHEVIFTCHEDQISATWDGQPILLKNKNGPRRGPIQIRARGGHLTLLSIERR
jgi:serine/threonine protein kinase